MPQMLIPSPVAPSGGNPLAGQQNIGNTPIVPQSGGSAPGTAPSLTIGGRGRRADSIWNDYRRMITGGRLSTVAINGTQLDFTVTPPVGYGVDGMMVEVTVSLSGAVGAGTAAIKSIVREIFVRIGTNQGPVIAHFMGNALDAAHYEAILKLKSLGAGGKPQAADPIVAANATVYYGAWALGVTTKKQGPLVVSVVINPLANLSPGFGTAPTGMSLDSTVGGWPADPGVLLDSFTEALEITGAIFDLGQVDDAMIASDATLGGELNSIVAGSVQAGPDSFNGAQLQILEDMTNFEIGSVFTGAAGAGVGAVGSVAGSQYFGAPTNPGNTANRLFIAAFSPHGAFKLLTNAVKTLWFVRRIYLE
jgi:hypothetical protein